MAPQEIAKIPANHRRTLLDRLSNHLITGEEDDDRATHVKIVILLTASMDSGTRRSLSERFARARSAPRSVIRYFARDIVTVAAPVLRWSSLFDTDLLADIIAEITDGHLLIVSKRQDLSTEMTAILLDQGSHEVHLSVARNANARLSRPGLLTLLRNAVRDHKLEEALCGRGDLPEQAVEALTRRVRQRLRHEVGSPATALGHDGLRLALRTHDIETGAESTDTKGLSLDAFVSITRLSRSGKLNDSHLVRYVEACDTGAVVMCLASLIGLNPHIVRRLMFSIDSEALMVAARAKPLDPRAFAALAHYRANMQPTDVEPARLVRDYERLPVDLARRIMAFHRVRRASVANVRSEPSLPHEWSLEVVAAAS